ncbi:MAG: hypothetical protein ACK4EY_15135 [Flavipsychrobacter sp.]
MKRIVLLANLIHYFATFKTNNDAYVTNDGLIFQEEENAIAHDTTTVKNGTIAHFERAAVDDLQAELDGLKAAEEKGGKKSNKPAPEKPAADGSSEEGEDGEDGEGSEEGAETDTENADSAKKTPVKKAVPKKAAAKNK